MKKLGALIASFAIGIASFTPFAYAQDKGVVGISMPTKTSTRWISDGETMEKLFKEAGYTPDLQFADDDIPNQLAQIENMVTKGARFSSSAPSTARPSPTSCRRLPMLRQGHRIRPPDPRFGQRRLLRHLRQLPGCVLQATSLVDGLKAKFPDTKPWNVELFGGSPDDNNAFFFYDGAMSVLQPLIDSGDIVIKSGRWHGPGRYAALGRHCCPGSHGKPALLDLHRRQAARRSVTV